MLKLVTCVVMCCSWKMGMSHGKSGKNHGILFLETAGNPVHNFLKKLTPYPDDNNLIFHFTLQGG